MASESYQEKVYDELESWHVLNAGSRSDYDYMSFPIDKYKQSSDEFMYFNEDDIVDPEDHR
jgi:hypothetical protein